MKKALKIILWSLLAIIILAVGAMMLFTYKITHGFPVSYQTEVPVINFPAHQTKVLLFSKSTGYRHGESIEAGKKAFAAMAAKNNWFLYSTEEGGVFNAEQLARFDVVVFNNCTGRLLNGEQQNALATYVKQGGNWVGIHGAGDNSNQWDWYVQNLVGASFSHHPIEKHLQQATVTLTQVPDSLAEKGLPKTWPHTDEWYVFADNPRTHGAHVIYAIDGTRINPSGNILFVKDKNFGMGKDHPVAWYRNVDKGRAYYTSMGHDAAAWQQAPFIQLLTNFVNNPAKQKN
jgi:type 1 glutamine amidotransferase